MRPLVLVIAATLLLAAGSAGSRAASGAACAPARVRYAPYPGHGDGLSQLPWVRGDAGSHGLVALLWYWPREWKSEKLREGRIFTGGRAPGGSSTKILWAFLAPSAKARGGGGLVVRGRRLDGPGAFHQEFGAISYAGQDGAPSFASIVDVPTPGCWRLTLSTGELRGHVVLRAVRG